MDVDDNYDDFMDELESKDDETNDSEINSKETSKESLEEKSEEDINKKITGKTVKRIISNESIKEPLKESSEEMSKRLKWYEKNYGPYIDSRGVKNWKNLFRKPTGRDWMLLFVIVLFLFGAWAYKHDTATCRETLENLPTEVCEACMEFQSKVNESSIGSQSESEFNWTLNLEKVGDN